MWMVAAVACFLISIVAHNVLTHRRPSINIVLGFISVSTLAGIVLLLTLFWAEGLTISAFAGLLLYGLECELYIFCFTLVSSSVSASILVRLRTGPHTDEDIEQRYNSKYMVESRINKLIRNGYLVPEQDGCTLSRSGLRLYRAFEWLRVFFGHDRQYASSRTQPDRRSQGAPARSSSGG